jgi:hypothetical protein
MATLSVKIGAQPYTLPVEAGAPAILAELIASGAAPRWLPAGGSTWIRTEANTEVRAPNDADLDAALGRAQKEGRG